MEKLTRLYLLLLVTLLLTGCTVTGNSSSNSDLTIKPYPLSTKETLLISKTGVDQINYFELTGTLADHEDLEFFVEVYEHGAFKENILSTSGSPESKFKKHLLSFATSRSLKDDDSHMKILLGSGNSLASGSYMHNMTGYSFSQLIGDKVQLEKNKPIYLVAWVGSTNGQLRTIGSEKGELPEGIDEAELALLYKVVLTDHARE